MHRLTSRAPHELRIELESFDNDRRVAEYGLFSVGPASDWFRLSVQYFSGNVTDSLIPRHDGQRFSTRDNQRSENCFTDFKAGFWYKDCFKKGPNINGVYYLKGKGEWTTDGVCWRDFRYKYCSLKMTEMKFRPK